MEILPKLTKNCHLQVLFRPPSQWKWARQATKFIAVALFVLIACSSQAATRRAQSGVVTRVVDGDTLWVTTSASQQTLKVRIQGIDAPEICQTDGLQAREALMRRVLGQTVTVTSGAHDNYGRTVGTVHLQGQDMGRWLVSQGHAWVYSYRHKKGPYADELRQARSEQRGVFSDVAAEEPRVFRKRHGSCYLRR